MIIQYIIIIIVIIIVIITIIIVTIVIIIITIIITITIIVIEYNTIIIKLLLYHNITIYYQLATGHRSTEADHGAEAKGPIMSQNVKNRGASLVYHLSSN